MPDDNLFSMASGKMVTKWSGLCSVWIRVLPQGWDWADLCYGVNPQVHDTQHTGEHFDKHLTQSGMLEELGCHDGGTHYLVRLFSSSWRDTDDYPQSAFSLQASHDFHKPRQRAWGLGFQLLWHHLLGWSSRLISSLGGSWSISTMGGQ